MAKEKSEPVMYFGMVCLAVTLIIVIILFLMEVTA